MATAGETVRAGSADLAGPLDEPGVAARSPAGLFWHRLRRDRVAVCAIGIVTLVLVAAIAAPLIVKLAGAHPPDQQNAASLNSFGNPRGPGDGYLLGTDELGRDIFSRTLYGARTSLLVAGLSTVLAVAIGVALGMTAGYYRGWTDTLLSRTFDAMLSFPVLLLALGLGAACSLGHGCLPVNTHHAGTALAAVGAVLAVGMTAPLTARRRRASSPRQIGLRATPGCLILLAGLILLMLPEHHSALIHPGADVVIFIVTLAGIPYMARIVRGQTLSLREKEFIEAAQAIGASHRHILTHEVLPNLIAPIVVYATLLLPQNVLFEAALSFLGVGVQPPTPSWGGMIASASNIFESAWWYMTAPGLALLITVLAFNIIGDGLLDALNPRLRA